VQNSKAAVTGLWLVLLACLTVAPDALSVVAKNGNASVLQDADKFSTALEAQISCEHDLDPGKAIGALQKAGIIERRLYLNFDSLNYFKAQKPLTVWGFKVVSVFGFTQNPLIFERGPGTAPPITLGVVVPYSVATVKSKLTGLGLANVKVQDAKELDLPPRRNKARALAEIYCEGP
jgi:hypothetical protein